MLIIELVTSDIYSLKGSLASNILNNEIEKAKIGRWLLTKRLDGGGREGGMGEYEK